MAGVGPYLRELRERQGLSIDELSRLTRVLHHYLEALERDDLASLPAPVFTRGFIRAYCQAVSAPPEEALGLYERLAAPARERLVITPPPPPLDQRARVVAAERRQGRARGAVLISFVLLVVLGGALFAVTLMLQTGWEPDGGRPAEVATPQMPAAAPVPPPAERPIPAPPAPAAQAPRPSPASVQPVVTPPSASLPSAAPPSAGPPSASPPRAPTPAPVASAPPGGMASPYRLVARTTETTWMSVRTEDGRTISEETIPAGQVREWVSNRPFVLSIGNAGGVALELNGQAFPQLGPSGAVIRRLTLPSENP